MRLTPGLVFLWTERKAALDGLMARALGAVKEVKVQRFEDKLVVNGWTTDAAMRG
jgi:hypothetical protein